MNAAVDMAAIAPGTAIAVDWSSERYHADRDTISRSRLVDLIENPARYHAVHEARTIEPSPPTPAMVFGTLAHLAVLEPLVFERRVLKQLGPDAIPVKQADIERLLGIRRAVLEHHMVAALLTNPTAAERTILWRPDRLETSIGRGLASHETDDEIAALVANSPPLIVRVRPDMLTVIEDDDGPIAYVSDLKTTMSATPSAFATACARGRYHLQAALYRDAVAALFQTDRVHFMLIAAEKEPPFTVACYDLDDDALDLGRNQYRAAMIELLRRRHTGDWTADWQRSIHTLSLPRWAYYEDR